MAGTNLIYGKSNRNKTLLCVVEKENREGSTSSSYIVFLLTTPEFLFTGL